MSEAATRREKANREALERLNAGDPVLVDVCPAGEVARQIREADSNEDNVAIAQESRGIDGHEFGGGVSHKPLG